MKLEFTKMHGAGNDFVVIDAVTQHVALTPSQIRRICDRHRGVGCDQLLLVEPPNHPDAHFRYRIFNGDGTAAGQCGNGARCFGRFVREKRLSFERSLRVQVGDAIMTLETLDDGRISACLGVPRFTPSAIPLAVENESLEYPLDIEGEQIKFAALSMGNPHAVITVEDVASTPVKSLGPHIEESPIFPDRANVGFMEVVNRREIRLRVWERGAGETLACGSGACAAVVHGIRSDQLDTAVTVHLPGGKLNVQWEGDSESPVWLGGPTATVFDGVIKLRR